MAKDEVKKRVSKELFFEPADVLMFQLTDGRYGAVICVQISKQKGQQTYDLVATTYLDTQPPTIDALLRRDILGTTIETSYDAATILAMQPDVKEIWQHQNQQNFFFGLPFLLITQKDMMGYYEKFTVIGKLQLKTSLIKQGGYSYFSTFEKFERVFRDLDGHMRAFRQIQVPLSLCVGR